MTKSTIFVTSDLHIDVGNSDRKILRLARWASNEARKEDFLILAGDYGNDISAIRNCLTLFSDFPGIKFAICGNHDIWNMNTKQSITSWERKAENEKLFEKLGFHALEREPFILDDIAIVGVNGWYDYSFGDAKGAKLYDYEQKVWKEGECLWSDSLFANWEMSDKEFLNFELDCLQVHLDTCVAHGVSKIIVVIHHVPHKNLLPRPRWILPKRWRFLHAFLGTHRFADLLQAYPQVEWVFSGHIHRTSKVCEHGQHFVSIGSTYKKKQLLVLSDGKLKRRNF